jgi:hypothetical protein
MVALVRFGHRHEAKLSHTEARTERMPPFTSALREKRNYRITWSEIALVRHVLFGRLRVALCLLGAVFLQPL